MFSVSSYFQNFEQLIDEQLVKDWDSSIAVLVNAWKSEFSVLVAGNGGNLLNALHFATDWNKTLTLRASRPLKTQVSGENIGLYSAIENDIGHKNSILDYLEFSRLRPDIFVLLSAGGVSENILRAAKYARELGATSIGLLGGTSHNNALEFDYPVLIKSDDIQLVEDFHAMFGHSVVNAILSEIES